MALGDIQQVAVIGAGIMGHGIAQSFIMGGYPVILYDISPAALKTAAAKIEKNLQPFIEANLMTRGQAEDALHRLSTALDMDTAVSQCDFVMEAVPENLALKQDLFQELDLKCRKSAILATNTSSLRIKDIGKKMKNPGRLLAAHWFNPPYIVPVVEVVKGDETDEDVFETTFALLQKISKVPVRIELDIPGFLINRVSGAMIREILYLYDRGIASAEDIDRAVTGTIGFQFASMGPLRRMDYGGLDLWLKGCEQAFPTLNNATTAPQALKDLVTQGHIGVKSGKGFYEYAASFFDEEIDAVILQRDRELIGRLARHYLKPQASKDSNKTDE